VCPKTTKLAHLREAVAAAIPAEHTSCVTCQLPDELISQLFEWAAADPDGGAVEHGKPRKQKITLDAGGMSEVERRDRERAMLKNLAEAMKRKPVC